MVSRSLGLVGAYNPRSTSLFIFFLLVCFRNEPVSASVNLDSDPSFTALGRHPCMWYVSHSMSKQHAGEFRGFSPPSPTGRQW